MIETNKQIKVSNKKDFIILRIKQKNTEQPSFLFCDKIEFYANHIMVYRNKELIFKVWLDEKKLSKIKTIRQAMKVVGIELPSGED